MIRIKYSQNSQPERHSHNSLTVVFFSSAYWDVSLQRVRSEHIINYALGDVVFSYTLFPDSEIPGSKLA